MRKLFGYSTSCLAIGAMALIFSRSAITQVNGSLPAFVKLQAATPGTVQTGHANLSGTAIVGGFKMATSAGTGKVLTSDSSGIGTWQTLNSSLQLPYTGTSATANNQAVFEVINSGGGYGMRGITPNSSGVGVFGNGFIGIDGHGSSIGIQGTGETGVLGTGNSNGLIGQSGGASAVAVLGSAYAQVGANYGGRFESSSLNGVGVAGYTSATNGTNFSGYFENRSPDGIGVNSVNFAVTGGASAGYFSSASSDARALYGLTTALNGTSYGVVGQSNSVSGGYGVWGSASANGYAVFGQGRLSATTKLFTIDHPLDPENKYLLHYCTEGPEPLNVYTGNVRTDASGSAWVTLPKYYSEINKDARYTLTVVDDTDSDTFVLAKVAKEIRDGRFKIRTSLGNVMVTWRVEGVRNDRWIQRYGAPVETMKPDAQRGLYIHPELYGKPKEMAINFRPDDLRSSQRGKSHP